jgi:hypothetical protein
MTRPRLAPGVHSLILLLGAMTTVALTQRSAGQDVRPEVRMDEWLRSMPVWHSAQLGIDYQLGEYMLLNRICLAARVAAPPAPGSPVSRIRRSDNGQLVTLEEGDLVLAMDEMAFFSRADFDSHVRETRLYYRDRLTGFFQAGTITLPATVEPSRPVRGDRPGDPLESPDGLGLPDPYEQYPFARSQAELRSLLGESIRDGEVTLYPPRVPQENRAIGNCTLGGGHFIGPVHATVRDQAVVESFRGYVRDPVLRQYSSSALVNVERLIDRKLRFLNQGQREQIRKQSIEQQIDFQYLWAFCASATARQLQLPDFVGALPRTAPAPQQFFVRLLSRRNAITFFYMPRLNWWIITRSQRRLPKDGEWSSCQTGEEIPMSGFYVYTARYADGSVDSPRTDLHITRPGTWTLP